MPAIVLKTYEAQLNKISIEPPHPPRQTFRLRNLYLLLVLLFLFAPIFILVIFSFNSSKLNIVFTGFTLDWYKNLLSNENLIEAFRNTLFIACISTLVSAILGTISAVGLTKFSFFGHKFIDNLFYIPIVIPEIVLGISLLGLYSLLKVELSLWTVLLSHIAFSTPFVFSSVRSTLYALPKNVEEASFDLGAGKWQTFWYVTLPLLKPGIISGAVLAFTLSLDDVVVSYFSAGPGTNTLPLYIYSIIKTGITPDVNALTSIMLLATITLLIISAKVQSAAQKRREEF